MGKKMLRNHRKTAKNRENIIFLLLGRVSKTGRPEIFAKNRSYQPKLEGWNFWDVMILAIFGVCSIWE